ncbi:MAG: phospholipid/glycerol acyltransferase [Friedmanniella sp.]|nr:phospholipid/glycerol acyltransferase [Friedmanniella sp.]
MSDRTASAPGHTRQLLGWVRARARLRRHVEAGGETPTPDERPVFPTAWARTPPVRALRELVLVAGLGSVLHKELTLEVYGLEDLRGYEGPALIVANHSSHLDTAVLLCTLPGQRRRRTAVAAAADYFFDTWWRAGGSAIAFNTFPIERRGGALSGTPAELFAAGWSVVVYPEGTRSRDGYLGRFRMGAAWMAVEYQVPVIPVGIRGTYAAMPRGRGWPVKGRPRVSVRYGAPIVPQPGDAPRDMAPRIRRAVQALLAEDETSWWQAQRGAQPSALTPPPAAWRRIWQQSEPPVEGGQRPAPRIWRH